jgi:hypothetical protein
MLKEFTKSVVLCVGEARAVVPAGLLPLELAIDREAFGVGRGRTAGSSTGPRSIAEGEASDGGTAPEKSPMRSARWLLGLRICGL